MGTIPTGNMWVLPKFSHTSPKFEAPKGTWELVSCTQGKTKHRTQFVQGHPASEAQSYPHPPSCLQNLAWVLRILLPTQGPPASSQTLFFAGQDADSTFQSWPLEFLESTKFLSPSAPFLLLQCFPYSLRVALQSFQTPRSPAPTLKPAVQFL